MISTFKKIKIGLVLAESEINRFARGSEQGGMIKTEVYLFILTCNFETGLAVWAGARILVVSHVENFQVNGSPIGKVTNFLIATRKCTRAARDNLALK